jgi:hypothetical protein
MGISTNNMAGAAQKEANGSANGAPSSYAAKFNLAPHFIGGNHLHAAAPGKVKDFVAAHDGHTVITNVRSTCAAVIEVIGGKSELTVVLTGAHCKQRYCSSQGNPLGAEVGIRDVWR